MLYIHRSSYKLIFYLFADDTNFLYADKNLWTLELVEVSFALHSHEWLTANKLTLKLKSNFIVPHPHQNKIDDQVYLQILDKDSKMFSASRTCLMSNMYNY